MKLIHAPGCDDVAIVMTKAEMELLYQIGNFGDGECIFNLLGCEHEELEEASEIEQKLSKWTADVFSALHPTYTGNDYNTTFLKLLGEYEDDT